MTDHMLIIDYDEGRAGMTPASSPTAPPDRPRRQGAPLREEIFEGLKAYRTADGSIQLFRIRDKSTG